MRAVPTCVVIGSFLAALAAAEDVGVPARPASSDYPVHQAARHATIAAAIVPADHVAKLFSSEIARQYVVVEVAVYPEDGQSFDVEPFDFSLRVGNRVGHTEIPLTGAPWPDQQVPPLSRSTQVTTETGVIVDHTTDPYGRRVKTVGTYTTVGISTGAPPSPPPPHSGPDPRIDQHLREKALGGGLTRTAVAGYLYFPQHSKRRKSDAVELRYSNDDGSLALPFPK